MKTLQSPKRLPPNRRPIMLAAGFFDGVHRGHRRVILRAAAAARRESGEVWVLTFDPHPRRVLAPEAALPLLTSMRHKLRLIEALGAAGCLICPFTPAVARRSPEDFAAALRRAVPALSLIVVGRNWRFGRGGRGDAAALRRSGKRLGFRVIAVPPVVWRGSPVSSTRIRRAVAAGRLEDAAGMLGRPFSALGRVARGRRIGRRLGFPTANLVFGGEAAPPPGVYAVMAAVGGELLPGVANFGTRPTFGTGGPPALELHLFDVRRNLYRREVEVFFIARLRSERKFSSVGKLRAQIARDTAAARTLLRAAGGAPIKR